MEATTLRDEVPPFPCCPRCGEFFEPFLRRQVQRSKRWFFVGRRRPYCALICRSCKEIVGYE